MALTVFTQSTVTIPAKTDNQLVVGTQNNRRGLQIQLLDEGFLWVSLNDNASKNIGMRLGKGKGTDITLAFVNVPETIIQYYEGAIIAYYEPGTDPATGLPRTEARIRVLSMQ